MEHTETRPFEFINFDRFEEKFKNSQYKDNFTSEGLKFIYEHWDEMMGTDELDTATVAATWHEYNIKEIKEYYFTSDIELLSKEETIYEFQGRGEKRYLILDR